MTGKFTCDACGGTFTQVEGWDPVQEMEAAFPEGIEDPAQVCDDCWKRMREAFPTLDARYKIAGLDAS